MNRQRQSSRTNTTTSNSNRPLYRYRENMPSKLIMTEDTCINSETEKIPVSKRELTTMIEKDKHEKEELEKQLVNADVEIKTITHKMNRYKQAADRLMVKNVSIMEENKTHRSKYSKAFNLEMLKKDKKPTDLAKLADEKFKKRKQELDEFDKSVFDNYDSY